MEGGGGVRVEPEPGRRRPRLTLLDQMSAIAADGRELAGLTLDDILNQQKLAAASASLAPPPEPAHPPPETPSRTLLEIIRDEDPKASSCKGFAFSATSNRDWRAWRSFKDRLSLNRSGSGANWTSSVHVPTSDVMIPTSRSMVSRRNSVGSLFADSPPRTNESPPRSFRPQISRRSSCRLGPNTSFASDPTAESDGDGNSNRRATLRPQMSRRHSTRFSPEMEEIIAGDASPAPAVGPRRLSVVLAEERSLSAREAVAAQQAAEHVAEESESESDSPPAVASEDSVAPVRMSLMDLLEETDRQMGFVGSRYTMDDDDDDYDEEEEEQVVAGGNSGAGVARNCCVCMVRHKGAAFIPCGHTFCRLCSRELWVSRGNCPLCNGFILEILDIF